MPRQQSITVEALERLGAAALATVLVEHSAGDAVLARKLRLLLAGTEGGSKLSAELGKRIRTMGASHSFIDWEKRKAIVQELDHLRTTIAGTLASQDPQDAIERMWELLGIADRVLERTDSGGHLEDVFDRAMADLGRLCAAQPKRNPVVLARRVIGCIDATAYGASGALIEHLSDALGPEGRAEIRAATLKSRAVLPALTGPDDWQLGEQHRHLAHRLALLADLDGDVDEYISALREGGMAEIYAASIAERLIAAGRPAEALEWLANIERPVEHTKAARVDLKVQALEALGRRDEAQAARWDYFQESLSVAHLREYLKLLPDFEDFEAEPKAFAVAASYRSVETALDFFIAWPNLEFASGIIRDRESELDGDGYSSLRPAAQALEAKYPAAATRLYRLMVESVLHRGASQRYPYAAEDLKSCVRLAPRISDEHTPEDHASFLSRLRRSHSRKYGFWNLMTDERR